MTWSPSESPWLRGVLVIGVLVVVITEGLGALGLIAPVPVAACWLSAIGGSLWWHKHRTGRLLPALPHTAPIQQIHPLWAVTGIFLALTFLIGIASAPNSWDAVTYHLPRIERWVEQGHLAFWPTSVDRQLWMSPWPGYFGLQFRLLTAGDQLAFLPSWLAYLGCIVLTAAVVRQLGGNAGAQAWGAFTMATIPPAVLQASAVQTDMIAGFWSLVVIALVIEAWRQPARAAGWAHALGLAAGTALALAAKGTAALALAPWLLLFAMARLRHGGLVAPVRPLLVGVAMVAAVNVPHLVRTATVFGSPFGASWTLDMLQLSPLTPGRVTGNVVANLSLHAGLPWEGWNKAVERAVLRLNEALGVDPAVQYRFYDGFRVNAFSTQESDAGLPVHVLLLVAGLGALAGTRGRDRPTGTTAFAVAGVVGFVLLVAVLRWQPFGARLQLAGLMWLPALAPFLVRAAGARSVVSGLVLVTALPALLFATPRRLVGPQSVFAMSRSEQFALERPEHFRAVEMALLAAGANGCDRYGLLTGWDQPEYYLTAVARREGMAPVWEHLISLGPLARLGDDGPPPEVCVLLSAEPLPGLDMGWLEGQFRLAWSEPPFAVHARREAWLR